MSVYEQPEPQCENCGSFKVVAYKEDGKWKVQCQDCKHIEVTAILT